MDRAIRSLSESCSCSGRSHIDGAHPYPHNLQPRQRIYSGIRKDHISKKRSDDYQDRKRSLTIAHSQSPRQPGGRPDNDSGIKIPPPEARVIASLVTAGLSGTVAVLGAALARIDLFDQFRWSATDELTLALALASSVALLEAALFGPRWDRLLAGAGRPGTRAGAVGLQLRTEGVERLLSADTMAAALVLQQACFVAAQVVRGKGPAPPPAAPTGKQQQRSQGQLSPPGTSPLVEVVLVLVRETAKELLQRGLLFTFLATWLTDRAFEAGADDVLTLPLALWPPGATTEVYLADAVRYAMAALLTVSLVPPVANEAEALRLGVASNLALITVQQQQEQRQPKDRGPERREEGRQEEGQRALGAAEGEAGAAVRQESLESYDKGTDDEETERLLREYRLFEALGRSTSMGPPRLTYGLTLLRGLLRFGSVNLAFALTGNLAATFLASAIPNLLLLAYVRGGPLVLLERPSPAAAQGSEDGVMQNAEERRQDS